VQAVDKHKPHVLFLDLTLPRLHGLEVLKTSARQSSPPTKVIVLSMHNDRKKPYVIEALRGGAAAYLLKGSDSQEIVKALKETLAGRPLSQRAALEWAINALTTRLPDSSDPLATLSPRERRC